MVWQRKPLSRWDSNAGTGAAASAAVAGAAAAAVSGKIYTTFWSPCEMYIQKWLCKPFLKLIIMYIPLFFTCTCTEYIFK